MRPKFHPKKLVAATAVALFGLAASTQALAADVVSARASDQPGHTRLVLDMNAAASHNLFTLESPPRVVIDLKDTSIQSERQLKAIRTALVKNIRTGVRNGDDLRIVMDVTSVPAIRSFSLPPINGEHRLVFDLTSKADKPAQRTATVDQGQAGDRDIVIVIDPGHGGKDPGATGPSGTKEKYVVMKLAKILADRINSIEGYKAILTRSDDRYLKLRTRTMIARRHGADLMVSVHADAFRTAQPKGASVFALSQRGATSETARWLANTENDADLIGGSGSLTLGDKDEQLAGVLLDLSMTSTINTSLMIGDKVLRNLGKVGHLHKDKVEQAGFVVLKSPDIPSLLVEAGFISNPQEERNLNSTAYLNKLAGSIAAGIDEYFRKAPPPGTLLASKDGRRSTVIASAPVQSKPQISAAPAPAKAVLRQELVYVIQRGDTLSEIARRHGVRKEQLKQENSLVSDRIMEGQELRIPTG